MFAPAVGSAARSRHAAVAAAAVIAVLLAALGGGTAHAGKGAEHAGSGPPGAERAPAELEILTNDASATASDQAIVDYWTPERMDRAVPTDTPALARPGPAAPSRLPDPPHEAADTIDVAEPATAPPGGIGVFDAAHFSMNTGKIFYTRPDGVDSWCSASAINSDSKRLVLTAGHCIHTGSGGGWMSNVAFAPAYHQGNRPFGVFPWRSMITFSAWINDNDHRRDVGMIATGPNASGQILVNTVGGHGFVINPSRQTYVHIVGYPQNFDAGEVQWNCWGTTSRWSWFDGGLKLGCGFGGGSSGSPWLRDYQSNGLGYAVGVMHGIAGNDNYSPYFDNAVLDMYNLMKDRT